MVNFRCAVTVLRQNLRNMTRLKNEAQVTKKALEVAENYAKQRGYRSLPNGFGERQSECLYGWWRKQIIVPLPADQENGQNMKHRLALWIAPSYQRIIRYFDDKRKLAWDINTAVDYRFLTALPIDPNPRPLILGRLRQFEDILACFEKMKG